jgi:hypothetical protein
MMNKKDPKFNILKVLLWVIFAAWVCFLGYCANGHNKYEPSSYLTPTLTAEEEDNVDGPKTYFVEEHGSMRGGGSRIETTELARSESGGEGEE